MDNDLFNAKYMGLKFTKGQHRWMANRQWKCTQGEKGDYETFKKSLENKRCYSKSKARQSANVTPQKQPTSVKISPFTMKKVKDPQP